MLPSYQSELYPFTHDIQWEGGGLVSTRTLAQMKEEYHDLLERLAQHRLQEPKKGHSRKALLEYQSWVSRTHDLIDDLNELSDKISVLENTAVNN